MLDAESGQRGYVLTGRREFLEPYARAQAETPSVVARVRALASGDPIELRDIAEAEERARAKEDFMRSAIALVEVGRRDEAVAGMYSNDLSKQRMDAFRAAIARLTAEDDRIMAGRRRSQVQRGLLAIAGTSVFSILASTLLVWGWRSRREAYSLRETADAQRALLDEREQMAQLRETFIGVLGHDLRNPLNAIVSAFGLVLARQPGPENARTLSRGMAAAERMTRMIGQILDLTRARRGGGIPVAPRETNLGELAESVVTETRLAHPSRTIELKTLGDVCGSWDPDRLAQVLSNLIGNALSHGQSESHVHVAVCGTQDTVRIEVANEGEIAPSVRESLFEPFHRGNLTNTQGQRGGLGLGLYITDQLARAHGGSVDVASKDGETRFIVRLPRMRVLPSEQ